MVFGYFVWWYGEGITLAWQTALGWLFKVFDLFSVDILAKSWFAPWKNDVLSARNIALSDQVKLWEQNLVSRLVGFVMRTVVIIIALLILVILAIGLLIGLVFWFLTPFLIFLLPLFAVTIAFI